MNQSTFSAIPKRFNADNLQIAFSVKTDRELKLAHRLYSLMRNPALVKLGGVVTNLALKLHLPINGLIKKTIYQHFCGGETAREAQQVIQKLAEAHVHTVLDYAAEAQETEAGFDKVRDEIMRNITLATTTKAFSYISIKLTGIGHKAIFEKLHVRKALNKAECSAFGRIEKRLDEVCRAAVDANLILYIDAEESWMQDPIDELAETMMLRYNQKRAIVFNTLQMYRTDRVQYLNDCLDRFKGKQVIAGIKIVRGAYLEKEQERASKKKYTCPVFTKKEDTDRSFNHAIAICLENLHRLELCAATHNEFSTTFLTRRIQKDTLKEYRHRIHFSQLYGMSDNLTFNLAAAGYNASKYLPYGEVETTVPYLIRRAEENTSIAGQMSRELQLLKQELLRRKL